MRRFRSIFNLPMISPFARFSLIWHMLMLVMDLTCKPEALNRFPSRKEKPVHVVYEIWNKSAKKMLFAFMHVSPTAVLKALPDKSRDQPQKGYSCSPSIWLVICSQKAFLKGSSSPDTAFVVPIGVGFDVSDTAWTWVAVCDFFAGSPF